MKADTSLFELIRSLSKTEKTYFKKFSSRHSRNGSASSVELFNEIEKSSLTYSEEEVKDTLSDMLPSDQFPVIKNYLYHNILKSLTLYHLENNDSIKLSSIINSADILYRRGLLKQAFKQLIKARTLANESRDDIKLLEILNLERKTLRAMSSLNSSASQLFSSYSEEEMVLNRIGNTSGYRKLFDELVIFLTGKGISHQKEINNYLNKLISGKLLRDYAQAKTEYSRVLYCLIHSLSEFFLGNLKGSLNQSKNLLNICRETPKGKYLYGYEYILALQQIVSCLRAMNREAEVKKYISELIKDVDDILRNYPDRVKQFLHSRTLISEVNFYMGQRQYEKCKGLLDELLILIPRNPYRDEQVVVNYVAAVNNYFLGKKEKALAHVNVIFNSKSFELRTDLQSAARIMNLILHYELGNTSNLKHFIRSVYNYLKKTNRLSEAETTALEFIRNISKTEDKDEIHRLFMKVKEDIRIIKSQKDFSEIVNLDFFLIWVDQRLRNG